SSMLRPPPTSTLFPYTTLFRSHVLLYRAGVQLERNGRQPQEVGRADSGHSSGQGHCRLHRRRADPPDRCWRRLPGDRVPAAGIHAHRAEYLVLFRWHFAADRGGGGDGLHCTDPGAPDVPPVREPAEEGQPEGRFARRVATQLSTIPNPADVFRRSPATAGA